MINWNSSTSITPQSIQASAQNERTRRMMRTSTVLLNATMMCAGCALAAAACTADQMRTELTASVKCASDRVAGKPTKGDSKACEYAAKTNSCFTTCACEAVTCDGFSSLPSGSPASMEQNDAYVQGVCDMMSDNNCGSFKCGSGSSLRTLITFTLVAAITVLWYAQ